jgi:hypothetical protein
MNQMKRKIFMSFSTAILVAGLAFIGFIGRNEQLYQDQRSFSVKTVKYTSWIPFGSELVFTTERFDPRKAIWRRGVATAFMTVPLEVGQSMLLSIDGVFYFANLLGCSSNGVTIEYGAEGDVRERFQSNGNTFVIDGLEIGWSWAARDQIYIYASDFLVPNPGARNYSVYYPFQTNTGAPLGDIELWKYPWDALAH